MPNEYDGHVYGIILGTIRVCVARGPRVGLNGFELQRYDFHYSCR